MNANPIPIKNEITDEYWQHITFKLGNFEVDLSFTVEDGEDHDEPIIYLDVKDQSIKDSIQMCIGYNGNPFLLERRSKYLKVSMGDEYEISGSAAQFKSAIQRSNALIAMTKEINKIMNTK
jgi:hypothetical protein